MKCCYYRFHVGKDSIIEFNSIYIICSNFSNLHFTILLYFLYYFSIAVLGSKGCYIEKNVRSLIVSSATDYTKTRIIEIYLATVITSLCTSMVFSHIHYVIPNFHIFRHSKKLSRKIFCRRQKNVSMKTSLVEVLNNTSITPI